MITPVEDPCETFPPNRNEKIVKQQAPITTTERIRLDEADIIEAKVIDTLLTQGNSANRKPPWGSSERYKAPERRSEIDGYFSSLDRMNGPAAFFSGNPFID
jgi:hypothetical protein